jgi:sigma-54 dependent transcriptional regulator of gfr operon
MNIHVDGGLSSVTTVGLYIHICCLIERLLLDNYSAKYDNLENFTKQHAGFIKLMQDCFKKLEKHYGVKIPISEIAYLHDYVYRRVSDSVGFNIDTIN